MLVTLLRTTLLTALSKVWVCGRSLAENMVSNPAGGISVSCDSCVLSGTGFCVGPITDPEEAYWVWWWSRNLVVEAWPTRDSRNTRRRINLVSSQNVHILRNSEFTISHSPETLCRFATIVSELQIKYKIISGFLKTKHFEHSVFEGQEPPPLKS